MSVAEINICSQPSFTALARTCPSLGASCGSRRLPTIVLIQQRLQTYMGLLAGRLCILNLIVPLG